MYIIVVYIASRNICLLLVYIQEFQKYWRILMFRKNHSAKCHRYKNECGAIPFEAKSSDSIDILHTYRFYNYCDIFYRRLTPTRKILKNTRNPGEFKDIGWFYYRKINIIL